MPHPDPLYVVVEPLPAGAPCDVDDQCGDGLACLCAPGSGCAPAFTRGVCSMACDTGPVRRGRGLRGARPRAAPTPDARGGRCVSPRARPARSAPRVSSVRRCPRRFDDGRPPWTRGCLPLGAARDLGGPAATPTTCSRTTPARPACARTSARSASAARAATTAIPARSGDVRAARRRTPALPGGVRVGRRLRARSAARLRAAGADERQGRPSPCAPRSAAPVTPPAPRRAAADPTASASAS